MGRAGRLSWSAHTPPDELTAVWTGAAALGLTLDQALERLGATTCDVFLNDHVISQDVPLRVWESTIGGYHVMKKWLSYREYALLNRPLTLEEIRHLIGMARRLAAVRLLEPALAPTTPPSPQIPTPANGRSLTHPSAYECGPGIARVRTMLPLAGEGVAGGGAPHRADRPASQTPSL